MKKDCLLNTNGNCSPESVVKGDCYRFTLLTSRMVRMEYDPDGIFEDRPTQVVLNRDFETPAFTVRETEKSLEINTEYLSIFYDKKKFSEGGLSVKALSEHRGIYSTWHFSQPVRETLWGTARTLDQADGAIPLEPGLVSRLSGYGVIDDSRSLILLKNGWIEPRRDSAQDVYFFSYGYAYEECLHDFFHLCGKTPLLPRYVFGNWWSRFHPYSAEEYEKLMDRFTREGVPLSVAVLDMDWHITKVDPKYGNGWTGYTWNNSLIPEPEAFLKGLHRRGLKVTLNLHPAEGIQPHEEMYGDVAAALGRDPSLKEPIHFDFCDPAFVRVYFLYLIHPLEEAGVDFWWIDWQQGAASRLPGADPLWLLNHFHFLDSAQHGRRPLIFSRYAGPGSHRYPIGFSGDAVISWRSLAFQPYFTATAANIGYGWWSHDIGGHTGGVKDEELMVRWLQFGVFSPVMRLHSTSNLFNGKEPWNFCEPARGILIDYLRLRHRLIPYLYTMNWRCHYEDRLLLRPMYYHYPKRDEAYEVPNQYEFGSELIVCPITEPQDPCLRLGRTTAWLPGPLYFDFFTGLRYQGDRMIRLYRSLRYIPVFAGAGAIVPLTGETEAGENGAALPAHLEIRVFGGGNGHFELYEDDGESMNYTRGIYACTKFNFVWSQQENTIFSIFPLKGHRELLPAKRRYTVVFMGVSDTSRITVTAGTEEPDVVKRYEKAHGALILDLPAYDAATEIMISIAGGLSLTDNQVDQRIFELLNNMQIGYEQKEKIYRCIQSSAGAGYALCRLQAMDLSENLLGAISEILFAQ